jgi:valyl-tRNA synthetase
MEINEKLLKPYNAKDTEDRIYKLWEDSGFFNPDVCIEKGVTNKDREHFSIVLPPPNVTGSLHTGHALMLVIQDIMVPLI